MKGTIIKCILRTNYIAILYKDEDDTLTMMHTAARDMRMSCCDLTTITGGWGNIPLATYDNGERMLEIKLDAGWHIQQVSSEKEFDVLEKIIDKMEKFDDGDK